MARKTKTTAAPANGTPANGAHAPDALLSCCPTAYVQDVRFAGVAEDPRFCRAPRSEQYLAIAANPVDAAFGTLVVAEWEGRRLWIEGIQRYYALKTLRRDHWLCWVCPCATVEQVYALADLFHRRRKQSPRDLFRYAFNAGRPRETAVYEAIVVCSDFHIPMERGEHCRDNSLPAYNALNTIYARHGGRDGLDQLGCALRRHFCAHRPFPQLQQGAARPAFLLGLAAFLGAHADEPAVVQGRLDGAAPAPLQAAHVLGEAVHRCRGEYGNPRNATHLSRQVYRVFEDIYENPNDWQTTVPPLEEAA